MKRFSNLRIRHLVYWLCGLGLLLAGSSTAVLAESPDAIRLYEMVEDAVRDKAYVKAAALLEAVIEVEPNVMARKELRATLDDVLEEANQQLDRDCKYDTLFAGVGAHMLDGSSPLPPYPTASTPASSSLVCRGGGDIMTFEYRSTSDLSLGPQLLITFEKGSRGVGQSWEYIDDLGPGQCAWLDRGVDEDEPSQIVMLESTLGPSDFSISWQGEWVWDVSSSLPPIIVNQSADEVQIFDVYDDKQGHFIVTGLSTDAPQQPSPDVVIDMYEDDDGCMAWDEETGECWLY